MAEQKLPLKDILAAIDMHGSGVWDELDQEQRKQINFWLLNRYASSVSGKREAQELSIFKTNEYYNKNYNTVRKHEKLLWLLLCMTANDKRSIQFHKWIGLKYGKSSSKVITLLGNIYPNAKTSELEMLASLNTKKELKELGIQHGYDEKELDKVLK